MIFNSLIMEMKMKIQIQFEVQNLNMQKMYNVSNKPWYIILFPIDLYSKHQKSFATGKLNYWHQPNVHFRRLMLKYDRKANQTIWQFINKCTAYTFQQRFRSTRAILVPTKSN